MKGTVKVLKKGAKVPDRRAGRGRGQEAGRRRRQGRQDARDTRRRRANTVALGVAGKGGVEYFGMVAGDAHRRRAARP